MDRLQELVGVPIDVISTGPERHETIMVRDVLRRSFSASPAAAPAG